MVQLTPEIKHIVKATAPVLAEHGYAITKTFYKNMFADNPSVKEIFNQSHQVELPEEGKAKQPWALAHAVHAYATYIDNLEVLGSAVERIAQKHVSLHILPEQYPIVGKYLLAAIKEVLGDAATPQIIEAWGAAYTFLADIFIEREAAIRKSKAEENGGWEGWRNFTVERKVHESDDENVASFYLVPEDGKDILTYHPGQYIGVRLETPNFTTHRNYSLSCAPGSTQYRITVKREGRMVENAPQGLVSNWLHNQVQEGDTLQLGVPCGDFVLEFDHEKPIVLLSAGVGLTPIVSMLEHLINSKHNGQIHVYNCTRNEKTEAMHETLSEYEKNNENVSLRTMYSEGSDALPKERLSMELLDKTLPTRDCHYFFCGPKGFMQLLYKGFLKEWEIPENQVHFEFFGPHSDLIE